MPTTSTHRFDKLGPLKTGVTVNATTPPTSSLPSSSVGTFRIFAWLEEIFHL